MIRQVIALDSFMFAVAWQLKPPFGEASARMIDADRIRLHMRLHILLHALRSRSGVMQLFRQRRGRADYDAMRHGGPLRGMRISRRRRGGADYDAVRHGGALRGMRAAANAAAILSRAFHGNGEVRPTTKFLRHALHMRGLAYLDGLSPVRLAHGPYRHCTH